MMTITEAVRKFRLPNPSTPEDLEMRWRKVIAFGDRVLLPGGFYNGKGKPCWFAAVYEFLSDDHTCEGMIGLREVSDVEFMDEGHALKWAMEQ